MKLFGRTVRLAAVSVAWIGLAAFSHGSIALQQIGRYNAGAFDAGASEIVAFDPASERAFVVNAPQGLDILDLTNPAQPTLTNTVAVSVVGNGVNSVDVLERPGTNSIIAAAVERTLANIRFTRSGYGSGMDFVPGTTNEVYLLTDRGANGELVYRDAAGNNVDAKIFPDPSFVPNIGRFLLTPTNVLVLLEVIELKNTNAAPLTGLPNPGPTATGEQALDLDNNILTPDPDGLDSEGLVALPDGTFWVSDEYGPHIVHFTTNGTTLERINPFGTGAGGRSLPLVYGKRRANRGMEGLTYVPASESGDIDWLVGIMQSTLYNPARRQTFGSTTLDNNRSLVTRLVFYPASPTNAAVPPREYLYLQEAANLSNSEIRYVPGTAGQEFIVLERDGEFGAQSTGKGLFRIDISGASNVFNPGTNGLIVQFDVNNDASPDNITLEQIGIDATQAETITRLAGLSTPIAPVAKTLFLDLLTNIAYPHDKAEGFVILNITNRTVAVINDDDFGIRTEVASFGATGQIVPKIIDIGGSNQLDHPILYTLSADGAGVPTLLDTHEYPISELATLVGEDETRQRAGVVAFFNAQGTLLSQVAVGHLPDMLVVGPGGSNLFVANEGEPNGAYDRDPEGSVSIISIPSDITRIDAGDVVHVRFTNFNSQADALRASGIRIFGPNATVAQDLEPEYIAVSADGGTAWVSLQENNAIAKIALGGGAPSVTLHPLGFKDHSLPGNALDASDRDDTVNIRNWPVFGMYQPDAIAAYESGGQTFVFSANEGDARDYDGFGEESRISGLDLDAGVFTNATFLQAATNLGRLTVTETLGDADTNSFYEGLYAFGARSFSVWDGTTVTQVFDSGSAFELITSNRFGFNFNNDNTENEPDTRSDAKGPEPEALTVGSVNGRPFLFVGLERMGGIMIYDLAVPSQPSFVAYVNNRDVNAAQMAVESGAAGDFGPEGFEFVPAEKSPTGDPLLIVANEITGTTTIYEVEDLLNGGTSGTSGTTGGSTAETGGTGTATAGGTGATTTAGTSTAGGESGGTGSTSAGDTTGGTGTGTSTAGGSTGASSIAWTIELKKPKAVKGNGEPRLLKFKSSKGISGKASGILTTDLPKKTSGAQVELAAVPVVSGTNSSNAAVTVNWVPASKVGKANKSGVVKFKGPKGLGSELTPEDGSELEIWVRATGPSLSFDSATTDTNKTRFTLKVK